MTLMAITFILYFLSSCYIQVESTKTFRHRCDPLSSTGVTDLQARVNSLVDIIENERRETRQREVDLQNLILESISRTEEQRQAHALRQDKIDNVIELLKKFFKVKDESPVVDSNPNRLEEKTVSSTELPSFTTEGLSSQTTFLPLLTSTIRVIADDGKPAGNTTVIPIKGDRTVVRILEESASTLKSSEESSATEQEVTSDSSEQIVSSTLISVLPASVSAQESTAGTTTKTTPTTSTSTFVNSVAPTTASQHHVLMRKHRSLVKSRRVKRQEEDSRRRQVPLQVPPPGSFAERLAFAMRKATAERSRTTVPAIIGVDNKSKGLLKNHRAQ